MKSVKRLISMAAAVTAAVTLSVQAFAAEPVAHITFDDTIGSAVTNGALAGTDGGNITYADGKVGKAGVFDGSTSVKVGDNLVNSASYTIALWANPSELTNHTPTFFGAADANHWISLVPYSWGNVYGVWSGDTPWSDNFDTAPLETGVWTHIAFTVDGENIVVYRNGEAVYSAAGFPTERFTGNASFFLGGNYWDTAFNGMMDEFYLYDTALSGDEIKALMNASAATEAVVTETEVAETVTAEADVPAATGNTDAASAVSKASADTGIEDVAVPMAIALAAIGAVLISRKRK